MNNNPILEKFSVTVPCTCGKKFKLKYQNIEKKKMIKITKCPICERDYNYILQDFLDHEQEIARLAVRRVFDSRGDGNSKGGERKL